MNTKVSIFLAVLMLVAASMACSLDAEMSLENLRMAFDSDGESPTTVYSPSDIFYAVAQLNNAPEGTIVSAQWIAVDILDLEAGELIYEQEISDFTEKSFDGTIYFQLSSDALWPAGEYKVDVFLDGNFINSAGFSVR